MFVEPRPKGRKEGEPIEDFVVETKADQPLATFPTQEAAIKWAREHNHTPHVVRTRHQAKPDHWREV
ncbi:hypothetical protein JQ615_41465 [Bradyrhizobium jicamae]|uniref:Uncharacterized protein n=1 Tax=Bradyrhizobium jicamae TaxID=280332 RepID=A0ABS5FYL0_9BRAD|nr:hypothetical protein [Bradyrhizobium jicamae]MBR0801805.1 hypothetical protein [Bradyrhizobium jicamae]MBR0935770.1 hypothetical protein [Bradyrhizobium jicamae]